MPSALSVSRAYSASASAPSTSGSGSTAKSPKRVGLSRTTFAANSLHSRASARAAALSPKCTPGSLIEMIDVCTPPSSISWSIFAGVQSFSVAWCTPRAVARSYSLGMEKWVCVSIRKRRDELPACAKAGADDRIPGISAPAPAAATLVKNVRLLSDMRGSLAQIRFGYTPPRTTIHEDDLQVDDGSVVENMASHCHVHDLPVAVFPVAEPKVVRGRFVRPWRIAYGVAMVIRRSTAKDLGGWDERFGPGVPDYPASDDMDFNYRLMRSGGSVYLTPRLRASHDQWRTSDELVSLYSGYSRAWGGFVAKLVRTRDPLGALFLTAGRVRGIGKGLLGAALGRSRFRFRLAVTELTGFAAGLGKGLRHRW